MNYMAKYALGIDYGTLSARALIVDVLTGEEIGTATYTYPHAVMDKELPSGEKLGVDYALQHPQDYLEALANMIPTVLKETGVSPEDIVGIGTDFTSCTMIPVTKEGTPLCFLPDFINEPHAYPKLWRHHAAEDKAKLLTKIAEERGEEWLANYGGVVSSEWALPKIWQVLDEAPKVYEAMDYFVEAGDWLVWQMTGVKTKNSCAAGFKGLWNKEKGYPSTEFFKALDSRLENVIEDKFAGDVLPLGSCAGYITDEMAEITGLQVGTPVAVSVIDAHVAIPGARVYKPGQMLASIGTSTCHILLSEEEIQVPGICGVVADGAFPGYYGYEAGQSCVGDHFAWAVNNCVNKEVIEESEKRGISPHQYLTEKAEKLEPGESGLVALDWWNGNRSVLVDYNLTGMIVGMTLQTQPEDIYRALIEATAYGTRKIVEEFRNSNVPVNEFFVAGGISQKNPMAMQIYADVLDMPINIADSTQAPALGAAIYGAVAAGSERGGYDDMLTATKVMGRVREEKVKPIGKNVAIYDKLYNEYSTLHDYFGRGTNDVMKRLKSLRKKSVEVTK